ncbi:MAG TPA: glycine--tRNA ligase subunit beta [Myxococcales bacterium]|nr:glycine--tRNA ligase subunit beta [Myxococcales bacterium]HAN32088.1 glycine--tRNA ligase subunit beta [Myxococcales bacterium]
MSETRDLLFELGCEEIPAGVAPKMATALLVALQNTLDEAGLSYGQCTWLGTPRRLTAHIADVTVQQQDTIQELIGPPARIAFDEAGEPTKAALGFARGKGLDPAQLYRKSTERGDYVAANIEVKGKSAAVVLSEALPVILRNIPQPKKMRWGRGAEGFIRPVQWLVALFGEAIIDVQFTGVSANRLSAGHRFLGQDIELVDANLQSYISALRNEKVMVQVDERRELIANKAKALAQSVSGTLVDDPKTLDVVTWLVEWPQPLVGTLPTAFMSIPDEVIITTLKEHQKLFTIRGPDGALINRFIAVANTLSDASRDVIATGNAKVVTARLSDAKFFYDADRSQALENFLPKLEGRIYLQGLGSTLDKAKRIERLSQTLATELCPAHQQTALRAAHLCKADLVTQMVFEFTELQGRIGADYALASGETEAVAMAIAEHYRPTFAGDAIPSTEAGCVVALADKLDSIVACFGLAMIPTGSQDPYALRRGALGVLHILMGRNWSSALSEMVDDAIAALPADNLKRSGVQLREQVMDFFKGRLKSLLIEQLSAVDVVDAVLEAGFDDVPATVARAKAVAALRAQPTFEPLAAAFKRVGNLVKKAKEAGATPQVDAELFVEQAEHRLFEAVDQMTEQVNDQVAKGDWDAVLTTLSSAKPAVDQFFDDVMVMHEDERLRRNRLALLMKTGRIFSLVADFSRIQA